MRYSISVVSAVVVAGSLALAGCDVKKTQEGNVTVPKYEVNKTQEGNVTLPKYDVTAPSVNVTTTQKTVTVPTVKTEEKTLSLPKLESLLIRLRDPGDDLLEAAKLPGLRSLEIHGKRGGGGSTFGDRVVLSTAFLNRLLDSKLIKQLRHLELSSGALNEAGLSHVMAGKARFAKVKSVVLPR